MDLVTFLRARLAEDEQTAGAAHTPNWLTDGRRGLRYCVDDSWMTDALTTADANHIARHDPARVLAEVNAKRRMVDAYLPPGTDPHPGQPCINHEGQDPAEHTTLLRCSRHVAAGEHLLHNDYALRLLALPYADHPDYQEQWRP